MSNIENIIDCKNLNCPMPVINTKKYFDGIENGTAIVVVDNEVAKNNIEKFSTSNSYTFFTENKGNNIFEIKITKGKVQEVESKLNSTENSNRALSILVTSDKLGEGEPELGLALMKSYLFALSEATIVPENLVFINSGVKLVTEGSLVLESIKKLQERGTNILSCGLCLDFYKIKDKLLIGEITNMYAIVEIMNSSNTIKL